MDSDLAMVDVDVKPDLTAAVCEPSSSKRKVDDVQDDPSTSGHSSGADKKPKTEPASSTVPTASTLVKLQGSKLTLNQKSGDHLLQGATSTVRELLDWKLLAGGADVGETLKDGLPDRFWGLIVKLCHESDKTLPVLAKQLRAALLPPSAVDDKPTSSTDHSPLDAVSASNLELLIATLLTRANYGLVAEDVGLEKDAKMPAGLAIWRWEAKNRAMYLPSESLSALEARFREREQVKEASLALWGSLSPSKRSDVLSGPASRSAKGKEKAAPTADDVVVVVLDDTDGDKSSPIKKPKKEPKDSVEVKKEKKEKEKIIDPVKEARIAERMQKEQEKAERRAAREAKVKEKEEKEKKEKEAKQRSTAALMSFFKKPAEPSRKSPALKSENPNASDYERTFLPFVEKRGVELAPINRFLAIKKRKLEKAKANGASDHASTSISADDHMDVDPHSMSPADLLQSFLRSVPASSIPVRARYASSATKSGPIYKSVRDVIAASQDAEISGNGDPHQITDELKDGHLFRRKLLQFREDTRPAYFGTWTQSSTTVGPRTPFAQDLGFFDYGYDSGCDWDEEEDGEGEDLDSDSGASPKKKKAHLNGSTPANGGTMWDTDDEDESFDEDEDDEDEDGSENGWMVDEDEADADRKRSESPSVASKPSTAEVVNVLSVKKGKGKEKEKGSSKRKKADAAKTLVPVVKGPFFEATLGVCGWDGFEGYKIQLLNDASTGLDPFTFVAAPSLLPTYNHPITNLGTPISHHTPASSIPRRISEMLPPPLPSTSHSTPSSSTLATSTSNGSSSTPTASNSSPFVVDDPSSSSKPGKYVPKPFPTALLPWFYEHVQKSTRTSVLLVADLMEESTAKGLNLKKGQVEAELKKRCKRLPKKDGQGWIVVNADP